MRFGARRIDYHNSYLQIRSQCKRVVAHTRNPTWHIVCEIMHTLQPTMEKRIIGVLLTLAGIGGLIYAAIAITKSSGSFKDIAVYGILGLIFFLAGIGLIRNTNDKAS